jgi:hypothetical protein
MGRKATTTATTTAVENESKDYSLQGKVLRVSYSFGGGSVDTDRLTFQLDTTFLTYDIDGKEVETDRFSINIFAFMQQAGVMCPELQLLDTLAMGQKVNPQIVALIMANATINVSREHHVAGEARKQNNGELYDSNCYTTTFVGVKTNINPLFVPQIDRLMQTAPAVVEQATANPFNI